jgi:hypothetical protein
MSKLTSKPNGDLTRNDLTRNDLTRNDLIRIEARS